MNTVYQTKKPRRQEGETLLPLGLNVEQLKRIHALRIHLSDVGYPWESDLRVERVVVHGDVLVSC